MPHLATNLNLFVDAAFHASMSLHTYQYHVYPQPILQKNTFHALQTQGRES